ncbi:nucleotidyltransferase family protein [Legionella sp. km535]|uniref:N-acetylmuramate alpha-1-phosphate uridylyltransferase MurU n=1 Tax=Legionella sp. km535 TaxID=2498107 RepID=UPI000F8C8C9F|nr:nucleotidyltransferase family protein [Legionella sp. km535]RUR16230.1 nucleotidyltransferase family protein [Legionella sp. km535]
MKVAMILAAGRGERLKPLTDVQPKALCMVKNRPLIEHHVINLANAGFDKLVINHAYLGGKIRQYLGNGERYGVTICYSPEPPGGLETGGGIVKALPLLGNKPFITVNADIFTDFNFAQLNLELEQPIHLILTNNNPLLNHHGDFSLVNQNQLSNDNAQYTFAGIAIYHPIVFAQCKQGRYSVTPLIRQFVSQNKVTGSLHQGTWFDIGSLERIRAANNN